MDNKTPLLNIKTLVFFMIYLAILPTILFLSAGTINWTMGWIYSGIILAVSFISRLLVYKKDPSLLVERGQFNQGEGTADWDRLLMVLVSIIFPILTLITAGLDYRFQWSSTIHLGVQVLALAVLLLSTVIGTWAMVSNPNFSASVRIQEDRNQVVIQSGPYRYVRHPGYSTSLASSLAFPFILGTLWAMISTFLMIGLVVLRTALED